MNHLSLPQQIAVWALPILFAVTVHETAHGWVASRLGDKTALRLGRLSLNPLPHIDLIGTILVPALCLLAGGVMFGWAKPVPVDARNLKNPRQDMAWVALAGPVSNLCMAFIWACIAKLGELVFEQGVSSALFVIYVGFAGIQINLLLMLLNILPIPPLDGSKVFVNLLPRNLARAYEAIEPYGFIIIVLLMLSKVLSLILSPPLSWLQALMVNIFSL